MHFITIARVFVQKSNLWIHKTENGCDQLYLIFFGKSIILTSESRVTTWVEVFEQRVHAICIRSEDSLLPGCGEKNILQEGKLV